MVAADVVRWGILGAGNIARRFCASLAQVEGCELVALAGRRRERLEAFAAAQGVHGARLYADDDTDAEGRSAYDRLIEDPEVDAIYLALPHSLHATWACRALRAGKAVLCEKPAALNAAEAELIASAARESGALFVEAMKSRFVPAHDAVLGVLVEGGLGAVTDVCAVQRVTYPERGGYLVDRTQGGCLLDEGCYCASWIEELTQGPPELEALEVRWRRFEDHATGGYYALDWADDARLRFGAVTARLDCAGDAAYASLCTITCEHGRIEVPLLHRPVEATVYQEGRAPQCIETPYVVDDFHGEIAHTAALVRAGATESPVMPLAATLRCALILDAIRAGYGTAGGDKECEAPGARW